MIAACLAGFVLGFSLILAIGAQNAFVLRQGLRGEHVLAICTICSVSDAVLIAAGVGGLGIVSNRVPWLEPLIRYGGALFLLLYAARSLYAALRGGGALLPAGRHAPSLAVACLACLMLTWANPHVYLDTLLLLGSLSSHYQGQKTAFALGAMTASGVFFFSLGYGAKLLRPFFARPASWRILDAGIGVTMAILAVQMII